MAEGRQGGDSPPRKVRRSGEAAGGCGVTVDCLPDEVMLHIFSSISFNDLVDNVQNVCTRWKRLAQDPVLWLDKEYIVWGKRSPLTSRGCCGVFWSQCIHCRHEREDKEILRTAAATPQLRKLTLLREIKDGVLRKMVTNWPNLTTLKIDSRQGGSGNLLEHIFKSCPKIQRLTLDSCNVMEEKGCEVLSALGDLRSLELTVDWHYSRNSVVMRELAAACPRLEEINFRWDEYSVGDVEDFLRAKRDSITTATLSWVVAKNQCVVPLLQQCRRLRRLQLDHYDLPDAAAAAAFAALGELHSLEELTIQKACPQPPEVMSLAFRPGRLPRLRRLAVRRAADLRDETLGAVCRGCPGLRELRLYGAHRITDAGLAEIHQLKHLRKLVLSGCRGLREAVCYIAQLPALHTLVLEDVGLGKMQPWIRDILEMQPLRRLDFLECWDIEVVPFDEFPGRLTELRELRVTNEYILYDDEEEPSEDEEEPSEDEGEEEPHEKKEKVFGKKYFAELQSRMPHLRVFHRPWLEDGDNPGDEETYYGDSDSFDDASSTGEGYGYYAGFTDDSFW